MSRKYELRVSLLNKATDSYQGDIRQEGEILEPWAVHLCGLGKQITYIEVFDNAFVTPRCRFTALLVCTVLIAGFDMALSASDQ